MLDGEFHEVNVHSADVGCSIKFGDRAEPDIPSHWGRWRWILSEMGKNHEKPGCWVGIEGLLIVVDG